MAAAAYSWKDGLQSSCRARSSSSISTCCILLLLLLVLIQSPTPSSCFRHPSAPATRGGPLMMGKWIKDPNIVPKIADLVKSFTEKQHQMTESVDRYLQDGIEAIKRHDAKVALTAFEQALKMNNETGLIWHHGAMLYYAGRYEDAIDHLDQVTARYEEMFEQPATEEAIWKAAALYRLHGAEISRTKIHSSQYGKEKRQMMGLLHDLFRGEIDASVIERVIEATKDHPYSNYDLYGNFYLGLYYDACGQEAQSIACLGRAVRAPKAREEDVMYHFPRLHLILRGHAGL